MTPGSAKTTEEEVSKLKAKHPDIFQLDFRKADVESLGMFRKWSEDNGVPQLNTPEMAAFKQYIIWRQKSDPPDREAIKAARDAQLGHSIGTETGTKAFYGNFAESHTLSSIKPSTRYDYVQRVARIKKISQN